MQKPFWIIIFFALVLPPTTEVHANGFDDRMQLAQHGDAHAQFNLGLMYEYGDGVTKSDSEAIKWFYMAAQQGHSKAQAWMGKMYIRGAGVPQDYGLAAKWDYLAANKMEAMAQHDLGLMYAGGLGVKKDPVQAYMWLSIAAQNDTDKREAETVADARSILGSLQSGMTPEQIAAGQKMAQEWKPEGK